MSSGETPTAEWTMERRSVLQSIGVAGLAGALGVGAVGAEHGDGVPTAGDAPEVRGTVNQVLVIHLVPGATVTLYGPDGEVVTTADARYPEDPLEWFNSASYVFREVEAGAGYRVSQTVDGQESPKSSPVQVFDDAEDSLPPQTFYDTQDLNTNMADDDIGYMEMRDGTTLAHQVVTPDESNVEPPYPTLVFWDGYAPSVDLPGGDTLIELIVEQMGYAIVAVNMRGTQCSGGKFDLFETVQILDGYDIIETVAAQEWTANVGMAGGSYGGYSQFYVGAAQPPSLAAIAPGMPVGDFYRDVGRPGGMLNSTFAAAWAGSRDTAARHDNSGGGDSVDRIEAGDETCRENQLLRPNNIPTLGRLESATTMTDFYRDRAPWNLVDQIEVPIFHNVAWQDEQVGSRSARLQERYSDDIPVRFVAGNSGHDIYVAQAVVDKLVRFFEYYVGQRIPEADQDQFDDYDTALAAYESEDPIEVLWEIDHDQQPRAETSYADWPPGETWELFFQPDGSLAEDPPTEPARESSTYEFISEGFITQPIGRGDEGRLEWTVDEANEYVAFVSEPLSADHICLGSGLVDLWLRSTGDNTDLQVTLSEVRPDGETEMFVQNGWLRTSHRAEDESAAKPRRPWHTHLEEDVESLPDGEFEQMRVELHPFGHAFREGSRVKIAIDNPGGTKDLWGFQVLDDPTVNEVGHTGVMPSKIELPLVPEESATVADYPDCGTVDNQPCRPVSLDAIIGVPSFELSDLQPDGTILIGEEPPEGEAGDRLETFAAVVENTGDATGTTRIEARVNDETVAEQTITLAAGESQTVEFSDVDLAGLGFGQHSYSIRVEGASVSDELEILEDSDNGDDPTDDEDNDSTDTDDETTDSNDSTENETDDGGGNGDGFGPGIGILGAIASLGGASYVLKRRLDGVEPDIEREEN